MSYEAGKLVRFTGPFGSSYWYRHVTAIDLGFDSSIRLPIELTIVYGPGDRRKYCAAFRGHHYAKDLRELMVDIENSQLVGELVEDLMNMEEEED